MTNTTDNPTTVDHVEQFGDKVHVNSAIYDNDTKSLIVLAQSGDPAANVDADGIPVGRAGHEWHLTAVHRLRPQRSAGRRHGDVVQGRQ